MKDDKDFERTRMGEYGLDINVEKHYRDIVAFILGVNTNWMEMEKKISKKWSKKELDRHINKQFRKSIKIYDSYRTSNVDEQIRYNWTGPLHNVNEGPWVIFCEMKGISPTEYYGVVFEERRYESNADRRKDNNDRRR